MGERGRLIALEGIDGCGKSTQARLLAEELGAQLTHEPGDSHIGPALRQVLLAAGDSAVSPRAEALLMAADRAQHVAEVVQPALAAGRWVVTDRFSASTLAYQGYGRGLELEFLGRLVAWATDGLEPDLTVLVDVPVEVARARRGEVAPDRLERLGPDFHERVRRGYLTIAGAAPGSWVVVEGTGAVAEVADAVRAGVRDRLGAPPAVAR